uniref:C2h2-type zn-finger protein n=1 Tax=Nyssomyia neivai TaxID=330878 RepID=A0A1L8DIR8_9DIPT
MSETSLACGKVCRLCLTKEQDVQLGDKIAQGMKFWQILTSITNLRYSPHDGLPQSICRMCAAQLTNIQVFRERCETSHETLLGTLAESSMNIDFLEGLDDDVVEEKYDISTITMKDDESAMSDDDDVDYFVEEVKEEYDEPADEEESEEVDTNGKRNRTKNYKCKVCGVSVESPSKLIRHIRTHVLEDQKVQHSSRNGKVFSCKSCSVAFIKSKHLRVHVLSGKCRRMLNAENLLDEADQKEDAAKDENTLLVYKCYVCSELQDGLEMLRNHLIETHERPGNPLLCCIRCTFAHESPDEMIEHYRESKMCDEEARSGDKETHFTCDICEKHFRFRCDLKKHSICHSGERAFECDICFKRFTRKGEVVIHKRQHFNLKPYMCQECGICFSRGNSLARHQLVHSGEAKWECDVCLKRFKWSSVLKCHMYSHTGEKPYKCGICSKSYTSRSGLVKHKAKHPELAGMLEIKEDVDASE